MIHSSVADIVGDIEHHIASFMFDVTAGHEQAGAVGVILGGWVILWTPLPTVQGP